ADNTSAVVVMAAPVFRFLSGGRDGMDTVGIEGGGTARTAPVGIIGPIAGAFVTNRVAMSSQLVKTPSRTWANVPASCGTDRTGDRPLLATPALSRATLRTVSAVGADRSCSSSAPFASPADDPPRNPRAVAACGWEVATGAVSVP